MGGNSVTAFSLFQSIILFCSTTSRPGQVDDVIFVKPRSRPIARRQDTWKLMIAKVQKKKKRSKKLSRTWLSKCWRRVETSSNNISHVKPRLHDEASSTSWLVEPALQALVNRSSNWLDELASSCKHSRSQLHELASWSTHEAFMKLASSCKALDERSTSWLDERSLSQLVQLASSCKRGISLDFLCRQCRKLIVRQTKPISMCQNYSGATWLVTMFLLVGVGRRLHWQQACWHAALTLFSIYDLVGLDCRWLPLCPNSCNFLRITLLVTACRR